MSKSYITYPNQKEIIVHKPQYAGNYMSVGNDEWQKATNKLTYNAFKLYLYMACNANNYQFALSKKAVQATIAMSDNTYTKVVKELIDTNYLVPKKGNLFDFYTTPQEIIVDESIPHSDGIPHSNGGVYPTAMGDNTPLQCRNVPHSNGIETKKNINKSNLSNGADAPEEREEDNYDYNILDDTETDEEGRDLYDLSDEELKSIITDFENRVRYKETKARLNLFDEVTQFTAIDARTILSERKQAAEEDGAIAELNAEIDSLSDEDKTELTSYLDCSIDEVADNLTHIGVDAKYFLRWIAKHGETFDKNGRVWLEDQHKEYNDDYIGFLKNGFKSNVLYD